MDITSVAFDYTRSDWYLLPKLLRRPAWTDPYFDEGIGRILMCSYSVPLLRDDKFEGVIVADVSLEDIRRHACQTRYPGEYRVIVSPAGTFVYHPDESFVLAESIFSLAEWHRLPALAELGRAMIAGQQGVVRLPDYQTGRPKWYAFASVPAARWSLASIIPEEEVLAPVRSRLSRQLYLLLGGLGVILGLVVLVSNWITRPLGRLAAAVRTVASGNLDVQVEGIRSRDEVGQLAATFNQMVIDLKANDVRDHFLRPLPLPERRTRVRQRRAQRALSRAPERPDRTTGLVDRSDSGGVSRRGV
jgi:sigma-B regulation protein RsbU (phosphoserine phosphatase)